MKKLTIIPIVMILSLMMSCCDCGWQFTEEEKDLIADISKGQKMRVLSVDNPEDFLILREKSIPMTKQMATDPAFDFLSARMLLTVQDPESGGVGLAAPQVGVKRRLIVVQRLDKEGEPFEVYINPMIVSSSEECESGLEGCLSVPGRWGIVERAESIKISYQEPKNYKTIIETVEGFTAVIFQHEIDHLDGILYTDRGRVLTDEELNEMISAQDKSELEEGEEGAESEENVGEE